MVNFELYFWTFLFFKNMANLTSPGHELSEKSEKFILLIGEELKSRKLFNLLDKVGLDDCFFQVHLDIIIMDCQGMDDGTDEIYELYDVIIEKHARRILDSKTSAERHARKVCQELPEAKKSLPAKNAKA